jgi:hypothetical protein
MKNIKKIVAIFIVGLLFASCAMQKPIYKKGTDKSEYNKELVKYYESKHK